MIKITVIAMGKIKESYFQQALKEYQKRLSGYCDLNVIELNPVALPENPAQSQIEAALLKEKELIIKKIPERSLVYTLCVEGKEQSSEELAAEIKEHCTFGNSLCFIIGSSYGLHPEVKALSSRRLSLSKMTFPHRLFRVMLFEQLYRAFKINEGSKYHK